MATIKPNPISPDMQARLSANRDGKLTTQQWKEIITEPLVMILMWSVPAIIILRWKLFTWVAAGGGLVALVVIAALVGVVFYRARRYARAPVHVGVFRAGDQFRPFWMFWKPEVYYDEAGAQVHFYHRLAPYKRPQRGERYLIYYLKDSKGGVLLSMAPAGHPDVARWGPSPAFQTRFAQRSGR
jgi:hypothetical protein